ncbi:MAG: MBOAT family protein [Planctomycetota bacterium]|nr:MBOAT family protein [Planctomycetota bacterium]
MAFNSTQFVIFFLVVLAVHWAIARERKARFLWLTAASCLFYAGWSAKFLLLVFVSSALDWVCGGQIHRTEDPRRRKAWLALSLVGNLGLLGFFKYFNFFAENVSAALAQAGFEDAAGFVPWHIVLPAGISFYTFQTLSYTIDIYRRELAPAKSPLDFLLYVSFFPQLVAGPIVRASDFLPQLDAPARFDDGAIERGVYRMACGLAKKVLLADMIGLYLVDPVFKAPASFGAGGVVLGTWGALFQFYLDFSAYSDVAIGAAMCLGFRLEENFDRPFLAQSISEFWRRWHISLSTWFRDYVFVPLGGRGANRLAFLRNMLGTMFLTGLWHGAGWNYVLWGLMHGVFTYVGAVFRKPASPAERAARPWWERTLRRAFVFNLVAFSMLFFRNGTVAEGNRGIAGSVEMLQLLARWGPASAEARLATAGLVALALAAVIHFTPARWIHERLRERWNALPSVAQAFSLVALAGTLAALSYAKAPFKYFQF